MKVFLAGVSCVGKTAVGTSLAARLGCRFHDLDKEIERRSGKLLGRLRSQFLTSQSFREEAVAPVLRGIVQTEGDGSFVMALTPRV